MQKRKTVRLPSAPHPEERATHPSRRCAAPPQDEAARTDATARVSKERRVRAICPAAPSHLPFGYTFAIGKSPLGLARAKAPSPAAVLRETAPVKTRAEIPPREIAKPTAPEKTFEAPPRPAFVPSEALCEFYRIVVNATSAWKHCAHRACLRGKRCASSPACFELHPGIFREFMQLRVRPLLRGEISLQKDADSAPGERNVAANMNARSR